MGWPFGPEDANHSNLWGLNPTPPTLSGIETLVTVLLSMLGLGGRWTVEKLKGVSHEKRKQ